MAEPPISLIDWPSRWTLTDEQVAATYGCIWVISNCFCTGSPESSGDTLTKIEWRRLYMWGSYSRPMEHHYYQEEMSALFGGGESDFKWSDIHWKELRNLWRKILELGIRWSSYLSVRLYSQPWIFIKHTPHTHTHIYGWVYDNVFAVNAINLVWKDKPV